MQGLTLVCDLILLGSCGPHSRKFSAFAERAFELLRVELSSFVHSSVRRVFNLQYATLKTKWCNSEM